MLWFFLFQCILIIQNVSPACNKILPIARNKDDGERKNPTTSYYRHNLFGPNTYAFGFEVNDKDTGNIQFRDERRYANGTIEGSHGYVRPDGRLMITHFLADRELGYLSQSKNFGPGDELKWKENWPTKKPNILMERPIQSLQSTVAYNEKEKLNLTSILLPVEAVKEEYGIDLNPPELEKELVNPAVLEVIKGEAPLIVNSGKKDNTLGFKTINKFIPPQFPIVPFELPQDEVKINLKGRLSDTLKPILQKVDESVTNNKYDNQKVNNAEKIIIVYDGEPTPAEKYVKFQENNAEKSLPAKAINTSAIKVGNIENFPQAKTISIAENIARYDKFIKQIRKGYLENIQ